MNYRHAFHAGNFADCLKHIALMWALRFLARKDKGFLVLDTHAGIGMYDLAGDAARRTGEAARGIIKLQAADPPIFGDYLSLIAQLGLYPGSPMIAAALLRPQDRLIACELHPDDAQALRRTMARHDRVSVHHRDGYEALRAFLPPPERRGLILIDPPFEIENEFAVLADQLRVAHRRFASGIVMAWYPIKHRAPVRVFHQALQDSGLKNIVATELYLREPLDPTRLNGCGLVWINPPFTLETEMPPMLDRLVQILADGTPGSGHAVTRLCDE